MSHLALLLALVLVFWPISTPTTLRTTATWYCLPGVSICHYRYSADGLYAAAGSRLRVGAWRGRVVSVCRADRCVSVRLVDWCGCSGIDLYASAFSELAPLSLGRINVLVTWPDHRGRWVKLDGLWPQLR